MANSIFGSDNDAAKSYHEVLKSSDSVLSAITLLGINLDSGWPRASPFQSFFDSDPTRRTTIEPTDSASSELFHALFSDCLLPLVPPPEAVVTSADGLIHESELKPTIDVRFGRGSDSNNNAANRVFVDACRKEAPTYQSTSRKAKTAIKRRMVEGVWKQKGRFVERYDKTYQRYDKMAKGKKGAKTLREIAWWESRFAAIEMDKQSMKKWWCVVSPERAFEKAAQKLRDPLPAMHGN